MGVQGQKSPDYRPCGASPEALACFFGLREIAQVTEPLSFSGIRILPKYYQVVAGEYPEKVEYSLVR